MSEILNNIYIVFWRKIFLKWSYFYFFYNNFHNSGLLSLRKLPDLPLNNIFSVLSIGLQYALSFKWPAFRLTWCVTIMPKGQSLTLINLEEGRNGPPGIFCFITFYELIQISWNLVTFSRIYLRSILWNSLAHFHGQVLFFVYLLLEKLLYPSQYWSYFSPQGLEKFLLPFLITYSNRDGY